MTTSHTKGAVSAAPVIKTVKHDHRPIQAFAKKPETLLPGNPPTILSRDQITVDPELQPRAGDNKDLIDQYAETLKERDWLPDAPLTLIGSDGQRWLVDGHNRYHAAEIAGIESIPVRIIPGDYQDALKYSLGVNSGHGLQRNSDDLKRAYQKAVTHGFCSADDAGTLAALLKCSERWARELTREARETVKAERDATIQKLAEEGKTQTEISAAIGTPQQTVSRVLSYPKRNATEMGKVPEQVPAIQESAEPVPDDERADPGEPEVIEPLAPIPQNRIGHDGKTPVELTPGQKGAKTRAHNQKWERKKYEIERKLRIAVKRYGRDQMIAFLKERLAAMEQEASR